MNNRELFGPSPQVAHGSGFQYVNEVSGPIEAVSRDATFCRQQHTECKRVGDKRSKILGKLLLYLDFIFGQDRAGIPSTRRDRSSDRTLALALPHASIFPFNSSV